MKLLDPMVHAIETLAIYNVRTHNNHLVFTYQANQPCSEFVVILIFVV
jgi:hypothetical protein